MPGDPSLLAPQWDPGPPQCPLRKRLLQQQTSIYALLSRADFATPLSPALWDIISLLLLGWEPPATLSDISDNATSVLSALLLPVCPKPAFTNLEGKITIIKTVSLPISLFCPPHLLLLHPMTLLCDLLLSPLSSADLPQRGHRDTGLSCSPGTVTKTVQEGWAGTEPPGELCQVWTLARTSWKDGMEGWHCKRPRREGQLWSET